MHENSFSVIPTDTESCARLAFNPNHYYMRLGKDLAHVLEGIDFSLPDGFMDPVGLPVHRVALLTIFQYREQLSDFQACESVRTRTDWKYALHLPMLFAEIRPEALCRGRSAFIQTSRGQRKFQEILDRLVEFDYLSAQPGEALLADQVLHAVCLVNRLHEVRQAMSDTLLWMTASRPNWMRKIMLPHWVNQYGNQAHPIPEAQAEQVRYAQAVGRDIRYLLSQVDSDPVLGQQQSPEIEALRSAWRLNYKPECLAGDSFTWRVEGCAFCPRNY